MRRRGLALALLLAPLLAWSRPPPTLTVYAAASLAESLQACAAQYTARTGVPVRFSFAASSILARQIEAGASADVFISADGEWMDYLASRQLIRSATRRDLVANRLVLIAAATDPVQLRLDRQAPIVQALGTERLALADPESVPAGRYARAALSALGVWQALVSHIAPAESVRGALAYVAEGEAKFGIVYATDARTEPRVRVVGTFPADSHPPIRYPAALTNEAPAQATQWLDYLNSAEAAPIWSKYGFLKL
ncbi:MAG: molybdate ABC transporter substrate-binding protein [Pseudomonadota bacterium]|jgi:molybdate transport system substrate-binding protein